MSMCIFKFLIFVWSKFIDYANRLMVTKYGQMIYSSYTVLILVSDTLKFNISSFKLLN